jgi:hypothetical protein
MLIYYCASLPLTTANLPFLKAQVVYKSMSEDMADFRYKSELNW